MRGGKGREEGEGREGKGGSCNNGLGWKALCFSACFSDYFRTMGYKLLVYIR